MRKPLLCTVLRILLHGIERKKKCYGANHCAAQSESSSIQGIYTRSSEKLLSGVQRHSCNSSSASSSASSGSSSAYTLSGAVLGYCSSCDRAASSSSSVSSLSTGETVDLAVAPLVQWAPGAHE
jgi:hypothetical protein